MDLNNVAEIHELIGGLSSKNVSELIKYRTQVTEAFNEKINHLRAINKAKRERKKKIARPRLYISESSEDCDE